jgi:hypothetical protein
MSAAALPAAAQSWGPREVLRKMTEEEAIALQAAVDEIAGAGR